MNISCRSSAANPRNIYRGDIARMRSEKRRYGALDGDWAKHCIKCGGRYMGGNSSKCPKCDK